MAKRTASESRRKFLKAVPAAVAGAVGAKVLAQAPAPQNTGPVNAEAIDCAEKLIGLDFHSDEEAAISGSLNQRLRTFQQLRQITIGPEIDPAIMTRTEAASRSNRAAATCIQPPEIGL